MAYANSRLLVAGGCRSALRFATIARHEQDLFELGLLGLECMEASRIVLRDDPDIVLRAPRRQLLP